MIKVSKHITETYIVTGNGPAHGLKTLYSAISEMRDAGIDLTEFRVVDVDDKGITLIRQSLQHYDSTTLSRMDT